MSGIKLSKRLALLASLVPSSGSLADVGTDHGYLPVSLAQAGHKGPFYATDINKGPLEHAKNTAGEHGLEGSIQFFLCDGLAAVPPVDTVVIAGMGGETIAGILACAPWTQEDNRLLLLQPMSKAAQLRLWLYEQGYRVCAEHLVQDGEVYEVLSVTGGRDTPYSPAELLLGHRALIEKSPLFSARLAELTAKAQRMLEGLKSAKEPDAARIREAEDSLSSLLSLGTQIKIHQYGKEVIMPKVKDIAEYFSRLVPAEMKMDFDNVGLLVGINEAPVKRALVALDITNAVLDEAITLGAELILAHHPLFFDLKRVNDADSSGAKIVRLLQNNISALCLHTNLDAVPGGVNDVLAKALNVSPEGWLDGSARASDSREYGMGRFGCLPAPLDFSAFLFKIKATLDAPGLRYSDAERPVHKVALCGGAGGNLLERAAALGCDTFVTADVKHDRFLMAQELGINLVDAGHFSTENLIIPILAKLLKEEFSQLEVCISKTSLPPERFY